MDKEYLLSRINYESYYARHIDSLKIKNGESYGLCPFHADKKPSFRVNLSKGVWTCPVCNVGGDVFKLHMDKYNVPFKDAMKEIADEQNITMEKPKLVNSYCYEDSDGHHIYTKERYETASGKTFKFLSPSGCKRGCEQVMYNLPKVITAKCVIITEGEKCADAVIRMGLCGTTLDSGADSKWLPSFTEILKDKNVVLLPDNDEPGRRYMQRIAEQLPKCKIIELPRLKPKGDIADWDGTKEELMKLIKDTPLWAPKRDYVPIKSFIEKAVDDMFLDPAERGVQTGLHGIDSMGGCFRRQDLIIIGGRPSMGKTAFMVSIMRNMAKSDIPILLFSLEMSKEQLAERLLCQESGASMHDITNGTDREKIMPRVYRSVQAVADLPIWIDETGGLAIEALEERLKTAIEEHGIKCVFIDYIQLMQTKIKNPEKRNAYIGHISRNLKRIAKTYDLPIVALGQVNRDCEKRNNKRPMKGDLKDSGDIEQDADVIILLYRDEEYNPTVENKGEAEAIFAKYRNGRTGTVHLKFYEHSMRFADLHEGVI